MSEASTSRARRVLGIAGLGVLVALLFEIPSAYAIHQGLPRGVALAALVFPAGLLGWHVLAERRRKRAGGKSTLTSSDRFVLRLSAVALIAIVPLLALDRSGVWQAIKRDGVWWLDWTDPPAPRSPLRDARLRAPVPEDAEALVWSSGATFFGDVIGGALEADGPVPEEALLAVAPGRIVVVIRGEEARLDALRTDDLAALARRRGVHLAGPLTTRRPAPDLLVAVSDDWVDAVDARLAGGGQGPAISDRLRGPAGALGVAVWRPRQRSVAVPVTEATAWMLAADDATEFEVVVQTSSERAGDGLRRLARPVLDGVPAAFSGACAEVARAIVGAVRVGGAGAEVRLDASVAHAQVRRMAGCIAGATAAP